MREEGKKYFQSTHKKERDTEAAENEADDTKRIHGYPNLNLLAVGVLFARARGEPAAVRVACVCHYRAITRREARERMVREPISA